MSDVDDRVVSMNFDNNAFENGVAVTQRSLGNLKQSLNMDVASASLQNLQDVGNRFELSKLGQSVEGIAHKFSALGVAGVTALATITSQALQTGENLIKAVAIDPITQGYQDYERKLTSVQTITNSTGKSLEYVSKYFDQLDEYADQTIYDLSDMTSAAAKFTNAGVGLNRAVPAIKGIANMTALAGQDSNAASIAFYNLSQSIAGGYLTGGDYRSLNQANIATKEWKNQMIQAAIQAGTVKKSTKGMYTVKGGKKAYTEAELFSDALHEGWANTNILLKVLGDYGDTNTKIGKKAQSAAQDVKDFGSMMTSLEASVGTGWTDTYTIIIGNLKESKKLFTPLSNEIGGILTQMSDGRNEILGDWKKLGGRDLLIDTFVQGFKLLKSVLAPVKAAFEDIFPPTTGRDLYNITKAIHDFVAGIKPATPVFDQIRRTAAGFFAILDIGRMIIVEAVKTLFGLFGIASQGSGSFLSITANIGDFLVAVRDAIKNGDGLAKVFQVIGGVLAVPIALIKAITDTLSDFLGQAGEVDSSDVGKSFKEMEKTASPLAIALTFIQTVWKKLGETLQKIGGFFYPIASAIYNVVNTLAGGIYDALQNTDWNGVLEIIKTSFFGGFLLLLNQFINGGININLGGAGVFGQLGSILTNLGNTLEAYQTKLKADILFKIAAAIALLAAAVFVLSTINAPQLAAAVTAMAVLFGELTGSLFLLEKATSSFDLIKFPVMIASLLLLAGALLILAIAVKILSTMSWKEMIKGLDSLIIILGSLAGFMKIINPQVPGMFKTAIALTALGIAIGLIAISVRILGSMDLASLASGLGAVAIILATLAGFSRIVNAQKLAAIGGAMALVGVGILLMATALKILGTMDPLQIAQGLGAIAIALATIAGAVKLIGGDIAKKAAGIAIIGFALNLIATAILILGQLNIAQMAIALLGLVVAIAAITLAMKAMSDPLTLAGAGAMLIASQALVALAGALVIMGQLNIAQMGIALLGLVVGLAALVGATYLLANPVALIGAAALIIIAGAMALLAPAIALLGTLNIAQIATALGVLLATVAIFAAAAALLTPVIPSMLALAGALALLGIAVALIGGGILALSIGLAGLAVSGAVGAAALVGVIGTLLGLVPVGLKAAKEFILGILDIIVGAVPKIIAIVISVVVGIIEALTAYIPAIIRLATAILVAFMDALVVLIPKVVDTGLKVLTGVLKGIADNIPQVAKQATRVILAFMDAIATNYPKIVDRGFKMIIKLLDGISDAIDKNSAEMGRAGGRLAGAIIKGMITGITAGVTELVKAVLGMGSAAIDAIKLVLGIHSPSKEFQKIGEYINEGLVLGITGSQDDVKDAFKTISDYLSDAITQSGQDIEDYTDKIYDLTDTINGDTDAINKQRKALNAAKNDQKKGTTVQKETDALNDLIKARAKNNREIQDAKSDASSAKTAKARKSAQDRVEDLTNAQEKNTRKIKEQQKALKAAQKDRKNGDTVKEEQRKLDHLTRVRDKDNASLQDAQDALTAAQEENPKYIAAQQLLNDKYGDQQQLLADLAKEQDGLTDTIKQQTQDVVDATKTRDDYNKSIRDQYAALQEINKDTTTSDYFSNLEDQVSKVNELQQKLTSLTGLGLNKDAYQKLLASGTDSIPFIDDLIAKGQDGVTEFNGLTQQLKTATETLGNDASKYMYQAGVDTAQGFLDASNARSSAITTQMAGIADMLAQAFKDALGIKSPSRVFREIAGYTIDGLVEGLNSSSSSVEAAAGNVGNSAIAGLQKTMSGIADAVSLSIDTTPTIRPVLDLTDVQKSAGLVNGMLDGQTVSFDSSFNSATAAANGYNANQEAMIAVKEAVATTSGPTFNQYNNSPVALSPAEIYRQTNNQLSRAQRE